MPRPLPADVVASTGGEPAAVREHILDAAYRVIDREGLAAASTRAIAEEARLGAGTLYNYFDDRLELLAGSILRRAHVLSRPLAELPSRAGTGTVAENLHRFAGDLGAMLDRLVPLFAAAFSDTELLEAVRGATTSSRHSAGPFVVHPVERYLLAEQALGRVGPHADCRAAASLILSLCHERAFLGYFRGRPATARSLARELNFIVRAITAPTADGEDAGRAVRGEE